MTDDLADRIATLEERVRRLEQAGTPEPADASEVFWALEGLKSRLPDGGVLFTGAVPLPTGEHYEWQAGVPAEELVDTDWEELASDRAATLGALGHPVRLLLVGLILTGTRTVTELQRNPALGTTGQLYHHLRQLVSAGWLRAAGRGRYAVPPEKVIPLLVVLAAARR
ncbi:MAG: ArsR/SmtB family transcription factor [bacterium]